MKYANITRTYYGNSLQSLCLFDVAKAMPKVTANLKLTCGGLNGTWYDDPFAEITSGPRPMHQEISALCEPTERTLEPEDAEPILFDAVCKNIEEAWDKSAFHIVFHSSGYDSRIIAAAIRQLGYDAFFVSNRWEAQQFETIMKLTGFKNYAAFTEGEAGDHFARGLKIVWSNAPCPIPGNLWHYLIEWGQEKGLIPESNLQCYTGLWANEAWNCFLRRNEDWPGLVSSWYGYNCMAALPVKAEQVEYPLVAENVLSILRTVKPISGDVLRQNVAMYASPETAEIPRLGLDDRKHRLSKELISYADEKYRASWYGKKRAWVAPTNSEFSSDWGQYSVAMLIEELLKARVEVI